MSATQDCTCTWNSSSVWMYIWDWDICTTVPHVYCNILINCHQLINIIKMCLSLPLYVDRCIHISYYTGLDGFNRVLLTWPDDPWWSDGEVIIGGSVAVACHLRRTDGDNSESSVHPVADLHAWAERIAGFIHVHVAKLHEQAYNIYVQHSMWT